MSEIKKHKDRQEVSLSSDSYLQTTLCSSAIRKLITSPSDIFDGIDVKFEINALNECRDHYI